MSSITISFTLRVQLWLKNTLTLKNKKKRQKRKGEKRKVKEQKTSQTGKAKDKTNNAAKNITIIVILRSSKNWKEFLQILGGV